MKKVLILLTLCLILCISLLAACGDKEKPDTGTQPDVNTTQAPSEGTTESNSPEIPAPAPEVETDPDGGLWSPAVQ